MLLSIPKLQAAIQLPLPYFPTIWCYNVTLVRGWVFRGFPHRPEMDEENKSNQVNNTGKWSAQKPSGEAGGL